MRLWGHSAANSLAKGKMAFPSLNGTIVFLISCDLDLSHTGAAIQCKQWWLWCRYLQYIHLTLKMKCLVLVDLLVRLFLGTDISDNKYAWICWLPYSKVHTVQLASFLCESTLLPSRKEKCFYQKNPDHQSLCILDKKTHYIDYQTPIHTS